MSPGFFSGISSEIILRPKDVSQEELLDMTVKLNKDSTVSGLLVQLPLPGTFCSTQCYCQCKENKESEIVGSVVVLISFLTDCSVLS